MFKVGDLIDYQWGSSTYRGIVKNITDQKWINGDFYYITIEIIMTTGKVEVFDVWDNDCVKVLNETR